MLPNYVCIGAARSGTTWLYDCLADHPEVFVPDTKDVNFFRCWWNEPSLYEV